MPSATNTLKRPRKNKDGNSKTKKQKLSEVKAKKETRTNSSSRTKPTKPTKSIKVRSKQIDYSLCIPTSILDNCRNLDQITHVVYQIAKAATLFNVAEIVVLDIPPLNKGSKDSSPDSKTPIDTRGKKKQRLDDSFLISTLLQFFVTPPYLVRSVFKRQYHHYLKIAERLPRLSALPFMRYYNENNNRYREGLAVRMSKPDQPNASTQTKPKKEFKQTKYINIGKSEYLELKAQLVPYNVRVTVDTVERRVVSPTEAYGDYVGAKSAYGYRVRIAHSFGDVFMESSFKDGYMQCLYVNSGDFYFDETLKKYRKLETGVPRVTQLVMPTPPPESNHSGTVESTTATATSPAAAAPILLVFGKWDHLKRSFEKSREQFEGCDGPHQLFDGQLELPGAVPQGNVPIEDACMIGLSLMDSLKPASAIATEHPTTL